ncbi:MAG: hypothetical protein PHE24_01445 [Patescibacteria group bacterium]|nr:hypothetical protein [Patescibacteria group bacterium]
MTLFSFLQKPKKVEETGDDSGKKIEFAQKLPAGEVEGKEASKGGSFNFLKGLDEREAGEKAPVTIAREPEAPSPENSEEEESAPEKKPKQAGRLAKFLKFDFGSRGDKNPSRILEVNLVKGEIVKFFDWQRGILVLLVAIFIAMAVLSGIYWGISWWGASNQNGVNSDYLEQYYKVSKQINELNPQVDQVLAFKAKLDQVNFLLERHIYWTNFFTFLEDNTLSNVYFSGFEGTVNGSYSLAAATDNLDAIDAQIKKLLVNPDIVKAQVDSGTVSGEKGKPAVFFSLSFVLDPKIFLYSEKNK